MRGFLTSTRITDKGLALLVNVKNKLINTRTCASKYKELRSQYENSALIDHINDYFVGKSVMATYSPHRIYRIDHVNFDLNVMNKTIQFKINEKEIKEITLEQYYADVIKVKIKERGYPLLCCKRGEDNEAVLLVMELCYITGLEDDMRTEEFKRDVLNKTKLRPATRMERIMEIRNLLYNNGSGKGSNVRLVRGVKVPVPWPDDIRKEWGIEIGKEFLDVKGKILDPPRISYKESIFY
jgi:hypothetical protein